MAPKRKRADDPAAVVATNGRTTRASAKTRGESATTAAPEPKKRTTRAKKDQTPIEISPEPAPEPAKKRGRKAGPGTKEMPIELSSRDATPIVKRSRSRKQAKGSKEVVIELDEAPVPAAKPAKTTEKGKKAEPQVVEDVEMVDAVPDSNEDFPPYSPARLTALYKTYADPDDLSQIPTSGLVQLCEDAGMPMEGVLPVLLAWQLGATAMGVFSREEFEKGLGGLKCDTPAKIELAMTDLEAILYGLSARKSSKHEVYNRGQFSLYSSDQQGANKKLHNFLFGFAKGEQRVIEIETALALLSITLARYLPLAAHVCAYMQEKAGQTGYKSLTKDVWAMLWDFCSTVKEDLEGYQEEDAWPSLIDEFVLWKKAQPA